MKEKIVIFGTGSRMAKAMKSFDESLFQLLVYIDNNQEMQGKFINGVKVIRPADLSEYAFDKIVVCSTAYDAITKQLERLGYQKEIIENSLYFMKRQLELFYKNARDEETKNILNYLKTHVLAVFNYTFKDKYIDLPVSSEFDRVAKLWYVKHKNKKMYMKKSLDTKEKVDTYYRGLCIEQDEESPHCYFTNLINAENATIIDAGVAEGNYALELVDKAKKIYLIECDNEWIEALKYTFEPYKNKVMIINKFLSENSSDECVKIDDLVKGEKIDYIKMDIEGEEVRALYGAKKTLESNKNIELNICAYHNLEDEKDIVAYLKKLEFDTTVSKGYMCFYYKKDIKEEIDYRTQPVPLVRGIVRGKK